MINIKRILLLALICLSFTLSFAEGEGPQGAHVSQTVLLFQRTPPIRPGAPSNVSIGCEICDNFIIFDIPEIIHSISFSIYDRNGIVLSGIVTPDQPCAELPQLSGLYVLVCETDEGRVLVGEINL